MDGKTSLGFPLYVSLPDFALSIGYLSEYLLSLLSFSASGTEKRRLQLRKTSGKPGLRRFCAGDAYRARCQTV
jgi:hypothetical protein